MAAKDVPIDPGLAGQQSRPFGDGVHGVEETLDAAFIFRFWLSSSKS